MCCGKVRRSEWIKDNIKRVQCLACTSEFNEGYLDIDTVTGEESCPICGSKIFINTEEE